MVAQNFRGFGRTVEAFKFRDLQLDKNKYAEDVKNFYLDRMQKRDIDAIRQIVNINFKIPDSSLIDHVTVEGIMDGDPDDYIQAAIDHDKAGAINIFDLDAKMLRS